MGTHERAATKRCSKCLQPKALSEFYLAKGKPMAKCKPCFCQVSKAWYESNKARKLETCAKRREDKRPEIKLYFAGYYQENRQHVLDLTRAYQSRPEVKARDKERLQRDWLLRRDTLLPLRRAMLDPAKVREYSKEHYRANKADYLAKWWLRQATKLKATPKWANRKAIRDFYREAQRQTEATGIPHEVDHIVPLQGRTVRGLHVENNLRVVTLAVNREKSNRVDEIV